MLRNGYEMTWMLRHSLPVGTSSWQNHVCHNLLILLFRQVKLMCWLHVLYTGSNAAGTETLNVSVEKTFFSLTNLKSSWQKYVIFKSLNDTHRVECKNCAYVNLPFSLAPNLWPIYLLKVGQQSPCKDHAGLKHKKRGIISIGYKALKQTFFSMNYGT